MAKKSKPAKKKAVMRKAPAKKAPVRKIVKKAAKPKAAPAQKMTVDQLLKKAYEPARLAMIYHPFYEGKLDIGPEAGMPVMEGKSLLFKYLGGVDAFPLCLGTKDPDKIIETVKILQPSLGGVNLEDISQPKCFYILERLRNECEIPVWHDDQQGTGTIVAAGAVNAAKVVGKKPSEMKAAFIGAGAANIAISRIMHLAGYKWENMVMCDSKGTLNMNRCDELKNDYKEKLFMCEHSNKECVMGGPADAMKGADILVAASKPGPGTVKPEGIKGMGDDSIVFATD